MLCARVCRLSLKETYFSCTYAHTHAQAHTHTHAHTHTRTRTRAHTHAQVNKLLSSHVVAPRSYGTICKRCVCVNNLILHPYVYAQIRFKHRSIRKKPHLVFACAIQQPDHYIAQVFWSLYCSRFLTSRPQEAQQKKVIIKSSHNKVVVDIVSAVSTKHSQQTIAVWLTRNDRDKTGHSGIRSIRIRIRVSPHIDLNNS